MAPVVLAKGAEASLVSETAPVIPAVETIEPLTATTLILTLKPHLKAIDSFVCEESLEKFHPPVKDMSSTQANVLSRRRRTQRYRPIASKSVASNADRPFTLKKTSEVQRSRATQVYFSSASVVLE